MTRFRFKILVKLFAILIRAVLWQNDPAGQLQAALCRIEEQVGA